jgi:hypothetical protein
VDEQREKHGPGEFDKWLIGMWLASRLKYLQAAPAGVKLPLSLWEMIIRETYAPPQRNLENGRMQFMNL